MSFTTIHTTDPVRTGAAARTSARKGGIDREALLFLLFVGPNLALFAIFSFWPILNSAWFSLHRRDMIAQVKRFVGLANHRYLAQDPTFHTTLRNSLVYTPGAPGELVRKGVQDGWATITADSENGPDSDFYNGIAAATMGSTGGLVTIENSATFEVGAALLPEEETFGCCTGGAGLAVMAGSAPEKPEAAFRCIAFATSPEITTYWSQNTGYMPVRKSAVESKEMQDFFAARPNYKVAVEQLAKTRPQDSARVWIPGGDQIIGKGLERIIINNQSAQEAFDAVAATLAEEAVPVIEAMNALS